MSFDVKTFRRTLGCFATGIAVVTSRDRTGAGFGITINSFTSVSLEPPLVLFCLATASQHYRTLTTAGGFAINVLAETQGPLSVHFATPGRQRVWDGIAVLPNPRPITATAPGPEAEAEGPPLLSGGLAHLVCSTEAIHDAGDHGIVIGRVQWLDCHPEAHPLLYFRGRYGRLGELFVPGTDAGAGSGQGRS